MKSIGFVVSHKENERRRALLPEDLLYVRNRDNLYFESGYGDVLGYSDRDYVAQGVNVVGREAAFECDIVCNPKAPEPDEKLLYSDGQIIFGWIHAVQGRTITDFLVEKKMTGIAWEDMFEDNRHCFWRNNEISGEAAIIHSLTFLGRDPCECKAALIGRGNVARGAFRMLSRLGVSVVTYDKGNSHTLRKHIDRFDIIVNAVLWDVFRKDHIVYMEDLSRMRAGSMIIDISCDEAMGIESSRPTTIEEPVFVQDGVLHYAVDHAPSLFYRTATASISEAVAPYIDPLVEDAENETLAGATVIKNGIVLDDRIISFQNR